MAARLDPLRATVALQRLHDVSEPGANLQGTEAVRQRHARERVEQELHVGIATGGQFRLASHAIVNPADVVGVVYLREAR
jgi:hypothetical protein